MDLSTLTDDELAELGRTTDLELTVPPEQQSAAVTRLVSALASEDPFLRDRVAWVLLVRWSRRPGALEEEQLWSLGEQLAATFDDAHPLQQKTFACLVLAWLTMRRVHRAAWADAFARWWTTEPNTTGLDARLGWLHAVAHGADYVELLAPNTDVASETLLRWCTERMAFEPAGDEQADRPGVWRAQEDTRLAVGLKAVLYRDDLPAPAVDAWLKELEPILRFPQPAPIPTAHSNAVRTVRALVTDIAFDDAAPASARETARRLAQLCALPT